MDKQISKDMQESLCSLFYDYGARESLTIFIDALEDYANHMSDIGLKDQAKEAMNLIVSLEELYR